MNEMVERVARAMSAKDKGDDFWDTLVEDGDGYGYVGKNEYRAMARAAIEAMREPTDRMCNRGAAKWDDDWCTETNALNMWQAMIDAALGGVISLACRSSSI